MPYRKAVFLQFVVNFLKILLTGILSRAHIGSFNNGLNNHGVFLNSGMQTTFELQERFVVGQAGSRALTIL